MTSDDLDATDDVGLLDWLQEVSQQHVPEALRGSLIPVAWLGRTSTDDAQDPTLSLPRQLENSRKALPPGFVIVAKFYDVESGRTTPENRGKGTAHEHLNIPIPRDGGIADLLAEAQRPDRRFVAVVCESIERVARMAYFSTKIEYELEQAGVALLAADEGIEKTSIPALNEGGAPFRNATATLTRRVKQAIAEWYVLNMLELAWGGLKAHTGQGYNIGKPPYGYLADRVKHPVKAKAREGRTKHRLVTDPVRGPVVTQMFLWRAVDRLGREDIAARLNRDPDRYPPPEPILGEGRRAVGAWTEGSVREVLANPKHTGYMVWNRRKRGNRARGVKGHANHPRHWIWSAQPTHEPLVTREVFESANDINRFRQGSRSGAGGDARQGVTRRYRLRSYVVCDLCGRRMFGEVHKGHTYYRCSLSRGHHQHQDWYADHPATVMVREDALTRALDALLTDRVFGDLRAGLLGALVPDTAAEDSRPRRRRRLVEEIADARRKQDNLIRQVEDLAPSGNADDAWRRGLQTRFAALCAEQTSKEEQLALLDAEVPTVYVEAHVLERVRVEDIQPGHLPEELQRELYDALHLELRYDPRDDRVTVTITLPAAIASKGDPERAG